VDNYITWGELALLLSVFWLPIFGVAAVLHWQLLEGRRWRLVWVLGAFLVGIALAFAISLSPMHRLILFTGKLAPLAVGGIPIPLLSVLLVTLGLLALRRLGLPPNNPFKPKPLGGSA
jgi:hypothetical protein